MHLKIKYNSILSSFSNNIIGFYGNSNIFFFNYYVSIMEKNHKYLFNIKFIFL